MGGAPLTLGGGTAHFGGATVLFQALQVRVWIDRDALSRAYHWSRWVKGSWGEDQAIPDWLVPWDVTTLRGFFGLYTYYRKFVKGFSQLATPLTDFTKKGAFTWTEPSHALREHRPPSIASWRWWKVSLFWHSRIFLSHSLLIWGSIGCALAINIGGETKAHEISKT